MALFQDEKINSLNTDLQFGLPDNKINRELGEEIQSVYKQREDALKKRAEEENLWVKNLISPDKIKEWEDKGSLSAIEVWQRKNKNELVPYMGTLSQGSQSFKLKSISDKLRKGQNVSPEEKQMFENFVLDMAEVQTRGYTFGGQAVNIGLETLPFMVEFGAGLLTTGGTASFGAASSKISAQVLKQSVAKQIAKGIAKTALNTVHPKTLAFSATRLPQQVRQRMGDILLSDSLAITPEGQAILKESEEKPALAFMKALGMTNIEIASEMSGALLVRPVLTATGKLGRYISAPILSKLPNGFADKFVKLAEDVSKMPFAKAVDNLGFNGILEEIGEERVGDLLKFAFNLDGEEGYTFEQLLDAAFPPLEQLAVEAVAFGATGLAMHGIDKGIKSIPKAGEKYTKDGFLLDAGIFRVAGYDSYLDKKVREELTNKGTSADEIENVLDFATRDDKVQFLNDVKANYDSKKEFDAKQVEKDIQAEEYTQKAYNELLKAGGSEEVAYANAKMFGQFFKSLGDVSKDAFDTWFDKWRVRYDVPAEGDAYHQSAMYKAPQQNFEDFYNEVLKKESKIKEGKIKQNKSYFDYSNENVSVRVPHDTVIHDNNKHTLSSSQWEIVLENLGNPVDAVFSNKPRFNGQPILLKILGKNNEAYGIVVEVFDNKQPLITTAFLDSEKNIDKWLNKNRAPQAKNTSSVTTKGLLLSDAHINIINYAKEKLNPNVKTYFQSAYHGTPHKFDEFSTENIGTGEGAQAHGWGLYFAENKDVSEGYRKALTNVNDQWLYDGKDLGSIVKGTNMGLYKRTKQIGKKDMLESLQKKLEQAEKEAEKNKQEDDEISKLIFGDYAPDFNAIKIREIKEQIEIVKNIDEEKIEYKHSDGQLFEVDIPEDEVLLDENKTFSEQSQTVQNALNELLDKDVINNVLQEKIDYYNSLLDELEKDAIKAGGYSTQANYAVDTYEERLKEFEKLKDSIRDYQNATGKQIYKTLSTVYNSDKEASLKLKEHGIEGITYDGRQDGRCYVVFDDNAIKVLKTYYQEADEVENEKLIAGFTYQEVMNKLMEIVSKLSEAVDKKEIDKLLAQQHILEDAFDMSENPNKYHNENKVSQTFLNAYYVMNNQEIPSDYVEEDAALKRSYDDLKKLHNDKKEAAEKEYFGYFQEGQNENIMTIMANSNPSTILHEMGHLFLNGLNELAKDSKDAKVLLDAVNKWLGSTGDYTTAQHEKFARSFEAYLYKGKAPNNALKKVFENFKEWLLSVYQHITEIERRGADISDEAQELFDRIFAGNSYYEERKEATNLLRKIKNIARREKLSKIATLDDNKLTEVQKRCKEVSYQILSVATGKDVNYLKRIFETTSIKNGYGRRREIAEELLEHADDKITTSGGMRAEWREFYGDTGVDYNTDTQELYGDYELAEKALDTIINKSYFDPAVTVKNNFDERAEYYKRVVEDAERQYSALISAYKKGNRNIALAAAYEWIDSLDAEIKADFEERFIYDTAIIERDENVDKFDKAKRKILEKALELDNQLSINKNEKYQEMVKEIVKRLDFLQPSDKAKLTANILDIPNTAFLMPSIDNILDIAKTMEDVHLRLELEKRIHKELQGTKNVKKGGRTVGKYNYQTNKIFEALREIDKLSPQRANEIRLEESQLTKAENSQLSYTEKLCNKFLSYKANGRTYADTELMKEIYDEIIKIKLIGKSAKSELELQEQLDNSKNIEELIDIVQNKKDAKFLVKGYISGLGNFESTLNAIFNKDIKERYASEVLYQETQSQAWQHEQKRMFEKEVAKIYNLPEFCWDKKILEYLAERHTYPELRRKYDEAGELVKVREIDRTLSKMDIINAYIFSKNDVLEKRLLNQFGEDTLNAMFDELSLQDVKLAELLMSTAQSFYPLVNKAFIKKFGLDLPKVSCYFPSTPERGSEVDMYNDYSSKSLNNGFTKARSGSELLPMDFHNPVTTLYSHIDGVAKFAFLSESLDKANAVFNNPDLKRVIVNKYGEDAAKTLEQILMNVTYKKESQVFNGINKVLDNMIGNWIQANVAVKPIVGLKQLLSANNYASEMPYMNWQAGFLKALSNPAKTIDYMMSIPYLKARYEGNFSNEFLKQTIENSAFAMSKKLKDFCTTFIKLGDIGAIIFGGKPYIDYLVNEKGMSEEQAIKQFILFTNRTQQSSAVSSLSNFQVNMTRNPLGKLFIAFKNSPQQYVRMCGDAFISLANKDITAAQAAKIIFQFAYIQPFLYTVATSGSLLRLLFTGDDDDLKNDIVSSVFNLNADAVPILGDIYRHAITRGLLKEKSIPQTTPLLGDIQREIGRLSKEDADLSDFLESIGYLSLHVGLGYNSKAIGTMGSGVGDMFNGEFAQGAMKVFGYTDKRSKRIVGNDKKKKE